MVSSISVSSSSMIEPQAEESKGLLAEVMQVEQSASNNRFSNPDNSNTSMRSSNRVSTNFSERFASRRKEIQKKQEEEKIKAFGICPEHQEIQETICLQC